MILENNLAGKNILLRTAQEEDAEFILQLRLNPKLNRFIKKTDASIEKQRIWIAQKRAQKDDYHLIVQGLDGQKLGVIALYGIDMEKKTFDWGRWIIAEDAPFYAAVESAVLLYDFAFNGLGLQGALFEVQRANEKVISFHKRFGAELLRSDKHFDYFSFDKSGFMKALIKYEKYHNIEIKQ
ncbi:GNAT family N-acetyltransferase [Candidatus Margulisiibacteriota bacterium]